MPRARAENCSGDLETRCADLHLQGGDFVLAKPARPQPPSRPARSRGPRTQRGKQPGDHPPRAHRTASHTAACEPTSRAVGVSPANPSYSDSRRLLSMSRRRVGSFEPDPGHSPGPAVSSCRQRCLGSQTRISRWLGEHGTGQRNGFLSHPQWPQIPRS